MIPGFRSPYSVDWQSPIHWSDGLMRNLRARWIVAPHLTGGTRWHELVSGNHGTLTNMDPPNDWLIGPTAGVPSTQVGQWGGLDFDGSNDYVDCGSAPQLNITGHISIAATVKSSGAGGTDRGIAGKGTYGSTGYTLAHAGSGNVMLFHLEGSFATGTTAFTDGVWRHVVGTYDGANLRIFVDGKLEGTTAKTGTSTPSGTNFEMGRRPGVATYWTGSIDDVMVWDRALSPGEVEALHRDQHDFSRRTLRRWTQRFFRLGLPSFNPAWARGSNIFLPGLMT